MTLTKEDFDKMTTAEKLDKLALMRSDLAAVKTGYNNAIQDAVPEEIRKAVAALEQELNEYLASQGILMGWLETSIKDDVIASGETIRGNILMAVWSKGRVTWDSDVLKGYAVAHPEILVARKEGAPSVSIRER